MMPSDRASSRSKSLTTRRPESGAKRRSILRVGSRTVSIDTNDVFVGRFVERVFSRSLIPDACCGANDRAEIRTGSRPQLFFNNDTVVWPAEAEGGASAFLAAF